MKYIRLYICIVCSVLMAGCINTDNSHCLDKGSLVLKFGFPDPEDDSRFNTYIETMDLLLFNEDRCFLMSKKLTPQMLDANRSITLSLPPGTYKVICWANVLANTGYNELVESETLFPDCGLQILQAARETGDRLYYAPYRVNVHSRSGFSDSGSRGDEDFTDYYVSVKPNETATKRLDFIKAHRTINIYITGLNDAPGGTKLPPTVDAGYLWGAYDFYHKTLSPRRDFSQRTKSVTVNNDRMDLAVFHSMHGEITDNIDLTVRRSSDGTEAATVNLLEFVTKNPPKDKSEINILISFLDDHGVKISVPDWLENPVKPGV